MKTYIHVKYITLVLLFVWNTNSQFFRNDIQTTSGPIRGTRVYFAGRTLKQYLGIPYAKPPVGQLRFKKPEPVERRCETYFADKMPPACIQYTEYPFPWYDLQDGKSEDCLYLNIWVPDGLLSGFYEKYSVMFWIHGGGFTFGSNRMQIYEGQALAAMGDVVVVTINFRLGVFGYLTSGTEEAPGNAGVYDMVEALKWVNQNIAAFGGDPEKVTLFGESSGSIAVGLLCVSPLTKGLFHRVIMQSSSPAYLLAENNTANIAMSQQLAKAIGCADDCTTIQSDPETVVGCLRDEDAFVLARTFSSFNPTSTRSFLPSYGDEVLPRNAREEIINGNFHNVDVLICNTKDEGSFHITTGNPNLFGFFGEKNTWINKSYGETMIRKSFGSFSFPDPEAVVRYYLGDLAEGDYNQVREQVYTSTGDFISLCPSVYFAESYSSAGNDVYFFLFVHRPSTTPWAQWMGVAHYEDVQFVFGLPLRAPKNYTTWESMLSRKMIKIWTDFTKRGSSVWTNWPQYSREDPTYIELDTGFITRSGKGPHKENCDFYREYFGFD
uniref:Carboxylic ester hydrolase n=1 Tax=Pardosa astrigera TaxID=317848 RepID=A0A977TQB3_PARAW|nr:carboxylesterase 1 [Pardosa astrigera]